jgi:hypothetical protein
MKSLVANALAASVLIALASSSGFAQTFTPTPHTTATQAAADQATQLQELTKKIEEQNAKIDMLSQQIHDRRGRPTNIDIDCIDVYFSSGRTVRESRRWQQPHRRAGRNAYLNRADAQHQRERAAKVQSHR